MATLYWGGGTGTWDGFTTGKWYTDVGRTTLSLRAPSAEDDVIFDSSSNATSYTVTISNSTTVCRNITISGPASGALTLAGSGALYIYGNLTLPATGLTRTFTGAINFYGVDSHTITTNGVTLASTINFSGVGTYTLLSALNTSGSVNINAGTFDTNSQNLTCSAISATTALTAGTLTLGASTVSATTINPNAPLTINGGTSNITLSSASPFIGNASNYTGNTFNNVTCSSTAITSAPIYGTNTFNNLTFASKSSATVSTIFLFGNQTITGTLTITGASSVNRYFVRSGINGTTRTLTVNARSTLTDVDFRDITVAGASAPWSGTRLGDCGGNTNITFPAPKTVYWVRPTGGAWTGNFWATSSGGAVSTANFPLAQDTAIIDNTGLNTGSSITGFSGYNLKTLTSTKTNAYTLSGTSPIIYGDLTLTASMTVSGFSPAFFGRVTQNLTSAGNTISSINCAGYTAAVRLVDNTTVGTWNITSGGLDTNNNNFTATTASATAVVLPFTLTLGSSAVSVNTLFASSDTAPVMTVSAGTSTITITSGSGNIGFLNQTLAWNNVVFSTAPTTNRTIYGTNTFNNLTFAAQAATTVRDLVIRGNQTVTGTLAFGGGASVTQRLFVRSGTPGTQQTITAAAVTGVSDIDFRDIAAAGASAPWSGTRLGDCQGNSGITFPSPKTVYWNLTGTQNWSATAWATTSGGAPSVNNFPLAQDTCVFNNSGAATTVTFDSSWNVGTLSMSARTTAMTLSNSGQAVPIYGNMSFGTGVAPSGTGDWVFGGTSTQTFTSAGKTITQDLDIDNPSCVFQHGDAFTGSGGITVTSGTYTTQNYNITCTTFSSSNTNTRSITFGTSTLTLSSSGTVFSFTDSTNLTFSGASSTINMSSTSSKTFSGGGQTFGTVSSTGGTTSPLTITESNTFGTLTNSARTYMIWTAGTTQIITNFTYSGAVGSVVRWYTSISGQRATIQQSPTGGSLSAVGANSVDGGNNSRLTFAGASPNYFYVKDIAYIGELGSGGNFFLLF